MTALLILVTILIITDIYTHSNKTFDAIRFNNIITPICATISVILFAYLTSSQIALQRSNGLRQNFQERFEQINLDMKKSITDRVIIAMGVRMGAPVYHIPEMNSIDCFKIINSALDRLCADENYIEDHTTFLNNQDIRATYLYLESRTYFDELRFLLAFSLAPTYNFLAIDFFLDEVNGSGMVVSDKIHFRQKVEVAFLQDYFWLLAHRGGIQMPDLHDSHAKNGIPWKQFRMTGIERHLRDFRKKISSGHA